MAFPMLLGGTLKLDSHGRTPLLSESDINLTEFFEKALNHFKRFQRLIFHDFPMNSHYSWFYFIIRALN